MEGGTEVQRNQIGGCLHRLIFDGCFTVEGGTVVQRNPIDGGLGTVQRYRDLIDGRYRGDVCL